MLKLKNSRFFLPWLTTSCRLCVSVVTYPEERMAERERMVSGWSSPNPDPSSGTSISAPPWSQSHDQCGFQLIRMQEQNSPELYVFADWIWLSGLRREKPWRHPSTSSKLFYHGWDIYEPSHLRWGCCPVSMVTGVGLLSKAGIVLLVCPPFLLYRHHKNLYLGYVAIFKKMCVIYGF